MEYTKSYDRRLPSMFTALKSRRILILSAFALLILLVIFSQSLYHTDMTWVSQLASFLPYSQPCLARGHIWKRPGATALL